MAVHQWARIRPYPQPVVAPAYTGRVLGRERGRGGRRTLSNMRMGRLLSQKILRAARSNEAANQRRVGSIFRIVDFHPMPAEVATLDPNYQQQIIGDHEPSKGRPPRHPLMHRTRSVDYAIVMAGEINMLLDEGEIHLKAGDVLIQQGTNHAWVNRGTETCRIAFVLIDAEEPAGS